MLLKYVSSYVTKMHESATSKGLYCMDVTGFQAANSFLRTVQPLPPEMAFQLSNIKIAWTDKMTRQFAPPHHDQEKENMVCQLNLRREPAEENMSLLQWLRSDTVVRKTSSWWQSNSPRCTIPYSSFSTSSFTIPTGDPVN